MTSAIEKNISEILHLDYGMDSADGDRRIGQIAAEAYRLFPTDFLRALEYAEERRSVLARDVVYSEASDSEVRDAMTETLRMFCHSEETKPEPTGDAANEGYAGYRFSMALKPVDVDVMVCMIDADADNEHGKGEDEGLRSELGASLRESLVEINGTGGTILMTPGELDLIAMLTDKLNEETEATLKALHARLIPAHNPIIVL